MTTSALASLLKNNRSKYSSGGDKAFKFPEGKTKIRILPAEKEGDKFWADCGVHWIKASKDGKADAVVGCRDVVYDEPCPIDEAIDIALKGAFDEQSAEIIKSWRARKSVLVNAIVRTGEKASADPQIVEMTSSTWGHILGVAEEYLLTDGVNIFDLENGMDIVVERRGKNLDTTYTVMPSLKSETVSKEVAKKRHNLLTYIESNFFREGDDRKALNSIAAITGNPMLAKASIGGSRASAMLTKPVDNAVIEEDEFATADSAVVKTESVSKKAVEPIEDFSKDLDDADVDDLLAELDEMSS
jgi:hypothetical protein